MNAEKILILRLIFISDFFIVVASLCKLKINHKIEKIFCLNSVLPWRPRTFTCQRKGTKLYLRIKSSRNKTHRKSFLRRSFHICFCKRKIYFLLHPFILTQITFTSCLIQPSHQSLCLQAHNR